VGDVPAAGTLPGASIGPDSSSAQLGNGQLGNGQLGNGQLGNVPSAVPSPGVVAPSGVVGFDASGLIQYAFAGVGLKLPRSSGEQYKVGQKVLPAQALPGDLIFYGPEGTQSVAMFIGNGQMVEATTPAVTVSPVRTNGMAPYLSRVINWQ
jgi:cell wall-associated NlpC family hydrolase